MSSKNTARSKEGIRRFRGLMSMLSRIYYNIKEKIMRKVITVIGFIFLLTGIAGGDKFLAATKSENKLTLQKHIMETQTKTIKKEIVLPQSRDKVWNALTNSKVLAEWI